MEKNYQSEIDVIVELYNKQVDILNEKYWQIKEIQASQAEQMQIRYLCSEQLTRLEEEAKSKGITVTINVKDVCYEV